MTLTTCVWVGVVVVTLLNLRLGWTLSGLVVPGYLVPLLIIKPMSVVAIMAESILTYCIVYVASETFNRAGYWSSFFGRDRFFAIVLVSVFVRVMFDGWAWPWLGQWVNQHFLLDLDYENHLRSYGLIIVSLIVNYLWKPGLLRGLLPLSMTVALTYAIIRFGLVATTNINLGSLHYLYEDIASSLLASPKAYIVLLVTAALASRMNLRYSWEFSGILIPSLLALQLHEPLKIVASLVESLLILLAATWLLKLPIWQRTTMAGARKLLFFFSLAFAYRLLLAHWLPWIAPRMKVTDVFGYGYLLSTLVAIRFHDRSEVLRILRATVQMTIMGGLLGSVFGFALVTVSGHWLPAATSDLAEGDPLRAADEDVEDLLRTNKMLFYHTVGADSYRRPSEPEIRAFQAGLLQLQSFVETADQKFLHAAAHCFQRVSYNVEWLNQRYVYLREGNTPRGWGQFVLDTKSPQGLVVEVPAAWDEELTFETGLLLLRELNASGLAIAGTKRRVADDGSSDVLASSATIYACFVQAFATGRSLQVRGHTRNTARRLAAAPRAEWDQHVQNGKASLWVKRDVPQGLDLKKLREIVGPFSLHWNATAFQNLPRELMWSGHAELFLSQRTRQRLLTRMVTTGLSSTGNVEVRRKEGLLSTWLMEQKMRIARMSSDAYVRPRLDELLYVDQEVVEPLVRLARTLREADVAARHGPTADRLQAIALSAYQVGYQLTVFRDTELGETVLVLSEQAPWRRHWGVYVFRLGTAIQPYVVQIPRPIFERYTVDFGVSFFQQTRAGALFVAGAHPRANRDGSADVSRRANKMTLFNLVHQVLLRDQVDPHLCVQVRAIQDPVECAVVVAADDGSTRREDLTPLKSEIVDFLGQCGYTFQFAAGNASTAGYELGNTAQAAALRLAADAEMLTLWLSPSLRLAFRQQDQNRLLHAQMKAVGIDTIRTCLSQHILTSSRQPRVEPVAPQLLETVQAYLKYQDVVVLEQLRLEARGLTMLVDSQTESAYLLVQTDEEYLPLIVNLSGPLTEEPRVVIGEGLDAGAIDKFIDTRAAWLELRATP